MIEAISADNKEMVSPRRIVVTGMGMISPLGLDVKTSWQRLIAGETGIVPIDLPFVKNIKVAGEIGKKFDPNILLEGFVLPKDLRRISTPARFALAAAIEACREARLLDGKKLKDEIDPNKAGVGIGTGIGGGYNISEISERIKRGEECSPFDILNLLPDRIASVVAIKLGLKGPLAMPAAACATGNLAITFGYDMIKRKADIMIVGGAEATIEHVGLNTFDGAKALSRETDPRKASRPFDKNRTGFVMSEGASVMVLEEREHALRRGAKILAEMVGYGNTSDAFHDTAPNGEGAERAMEEAIEQMGGLPESGLTYVHAHGTGTPMNDKTEIPVIKRVVYDRHKLKEVAVSSTKGATGHMIGAAGSTGAVFSVKAIVEGVLPPTINLEEPMDEAVGMDLVPNVARKAQPVIAINNSFGFGGFNIVTIFKKSEG